MNKGSKYLALFLILLTAVIVVGGITIWSRYSPNQPIEIPIPESTSQEQSKLVYIGGAVNFPGFYPLKATDSINDIIQAAGGTADNADPSQIRVYVSGIEETEQPQRINLNRAEGWLLEALPGIGQTRAQAIIDYRQQYGLFRNTADIIGVANIGLATYEQIKHLITVAD